MLYRYIKLNILKKRGSDPYIQLSEVKFKKTDDTEFRWPSGTICTPSTSAVSSAESANKLIDGSTSTKFCTMATTTSILFDLSAGNSIDLNTYSKWCWYTANDGDARDPVSFDLLVSQDSVNWYVVDTVENASIPTSRQVLAYTGTIELPQISEVKYLVKSDNTFYTMEESGLGEELWNGQIYTGYYPYSHAYTGRPLGIYKNGNSTTRYAMVEIEPGKTYNVTVSGTLSRSRMRTLNSSFTMPLSFEGTGELNTDCNNWFSDIETENPTPPISWTFTAGINDYYLLIYGIGDSTAASATFSVSCKEILQNVLVPLSISSLSAQAFKDYGFEFAPRGADLVSLNSPTIYKWSDADVTDFSVLVEATPFPQTLTITADLSDLTTTGITGLSATYEGNITTQYSYNNSTWSTEETIEEFLETDVETLYNGLTSSKKIYFRIILNDLTASFTEFIMTYRN